MKNIDVNKITISDKDTCKKRGYKYLINYK